MNRLEGSNKRQRLIFNEGASIHGILQNGSPALLEYVSKEELTQLILKHQVDGKAALLSSLELTTPNPHFANHAFELTDFIFQTRMVIIPIPEGQNYKNMFNKELSKLLTYAVYHRTPSSTLELLIKFVHSRIIHDTDKNTGTDTEVDLKYREMWSLSEDGVGRGPLTIAAEIGNMDILRIILRELRGGGFNSCYNCIRSSVCRSDDMSEQEVLLFGNKRNCCCSMDGGDRMSNSSSSHNNNSYTKTHAVGSTIVTTTALTCSSIQQQQQRDHMFQSGNHGVLALHTSLVFRNDEVAVQLLQVKEIQDQFRRKEDYVNVSRQHGVYCGQCVLLAILRGFTNVLREMLKVNFVLTSNMTFDYCVLKLKFCRDLKPYDGKIDDFVEEIRCEKFARERQNLFPLLMLRKRIHSLSKHDNNHNDDDDSHTSFTSMTINSMDSKTHYLWGMIPDEVIRHISAYVFTFQEEEYRNERKEYYIQINQIMRDKLAGRIPPAEVSAEVPIEVDDNDED